ncbi:MAG: redox-sensing transcriptional repressor Rex [Tannerellaceae bacterium]|jgi:redox-sensing transcriptional repressor|nr:redox-sensing transcriptional repressor Rex [Tannerellaceae bacterium]
MTYSYTPRVCPLPEPTLRRLPWYLAFVKLLHAGGETFVSSTQMAIEIGAAPSQVSKDMSYINVRGRTKVGYEIERLIIVIEAYLGFNVRRKAVIFGVGSLGGALLHDTGLRQYGLEIIAGFDSRPIPEGTLINNIPVYHTSQYPELQKTMDAVIGIVTVPVEQAQIAADEIISGGIHALWNFTPFRIRVPEGVVVQNTSMYAHLAVMFNRLKFLDVKQ